jgi:hypothetical protein
MSHARARFVAPFVLLAAGLATSMLAGCATSVEQEVVQNHSPELASYDKTEREILLQMSETQWVNYRGAREDLGKLFLTDRPSRLAPYPLR